MSDAGIGGVLVAVHICCLAGCIAVFRLRAHTIFAHRECSYVFLSAFGFSLALFFSVTLPRLSQSFANTPLPRLARSVGICLLLLPLCLRLVRLVLVSRGHRKCLGYADVNAWTEYMQHVMDLTSWKNLRWVWAAFLIIHIFGAAVSIQAYCEHTKITDCGGTFCTWSLGWFWLDTWDLIWMGLYSLVLLGLLFHVQQGTVYLWELRTTHATLFILLFILWIVGSTVKSCGACEALVSCLPPVLLVLSFITDIIPRAAAPRLSVVVWARSHSSRHGDRMGDKDSDSDGDKKLRANGFSMPTALHTSEFDRVQTKSEPTTTVAAKETHLLGSVTLDMLLEHPATHHAFKQHLANEFSTENLAAYQEAKFIMTSIDSKLHEAVHRTYLLYMRHLQPNSVLPVNIAPHVCEQVLDAVNALRLHPTYAQTAEAIHASAKYTTMTPKLQKRRGKRAEEAPPPQRTSSVPTTTADGAATPEVLSVCAKEIRALKQAVGKVKASIHALIVEDSLVRFLLDPAIRELIKQSGVGAAPPV